MHDVIVVGGGVIGLAIARELSSHRSVLLLERSAAAASASWAAAGMLTPQSEISDQGPFFKLCWESLQRYRSFAEGLKAESGTDPEYGQPGTIVLGCSEAEFDSLCAQAEWQRSIDLSAEILTPAEVLKLEPLITASIHGALFLPEDRQVVPRLLVAALGQACRIRGVDVRQGIDVEAVLSARGKVLGVRAAGTTFESDEVIVASGVWSGNINGLDPAIPLRPRKGQILSLGMRPDSFKHMIRGEHGYFVPRRNGELVVGATNEDTGFDRSLTVGGIAGLLSEARRISSHVENLEIREMWTGLRPATPDGLPILGRSAIRGLYYATGHYRNGILLAPVTAAIITAVLTSRDVPVPIDAFAPARFNV